jgi:hypothetical protein
MSWEAATKLSPYVRKCLVKATQELLDSIDPEKKKQGSPEDLINLLRQNKRE